MHALTLDGIKSDAQPCLLIDGIVFNRAMLTKYFDMVCDQSNWKNAIGATVELDDAAVRVMAKAIEFFGGGTAVFKRLTSRVAQARNCKVYVVTAPGYYAATGA